MNKFFNFQRKHRAIFLTVLFIITAFFLYKTMSLTINADFSSLFNQTEPITYYGGGDFNEDELMLF